MGFWHQAQSDKYFFFSASDSRINPCFTAGKPIGVWNRHAIRRHRNTTIFTTAVYVRHNRSWAVRERVVASQHCSRTLGDDCDDNWQLRIGNSDVQACTLVSQTPESTAVLRQAAEHGQQAHRQERGIGTTLPIRYDYLAYLPVLLFLPRSSARVRWSCVATIMQRKYSDSRKHLTSR